MRFKIEKKDFNAAFTTLMKLAGHSTVRVVEAALKKNVLRLSATDAKNTLRLDVLCESEDEGTLLLDGPRFWPVLKELPEGPVTVTVGDVAVNVDWDRGNCQFPVSVYDEFPPLPKIGASPDTPIRTLILDRGVIDDVVAGVIPATADENDFQPILGCVYFDIEGQNVTVVGTDAQMLLTREASVRGLDDEKFSFLVPKSAIAALALAMPADADTVTIHCDGKILSCSGEGFRLVSLCVDKAYPAYRTVMTTGGGGRLTVGRKDLISAVRRVAALTSARDEKDTVSLSLTGGIGATAEVQAQNLADFSSVKEMLQCEWDGEAMTIGFKVQRLLAILGSTAAERVTFQITAPDQRVMFLPEGDEDAKGMIMPAPVRAFVEPPKRKKK